MNRQEVLSHLRETPEVSVLVIGGGINGIGVFRELALNGVDVLLVERADFCSGGSAASSHLAHGRLRDLETGNLRLARAAARERDLLLSNAPHLVKPLPVTLPVFKRLAGLLKAPLRFLGGDVPAYERGSLVVRLGLKLYDAVSHPGAVPGHFFLSRRKSLKRWGWLDPRIVGTATFHEAAILNPERLALELLLDAEQENPGAHALNYMSMVGGMEDTIILRDELTDENFDLKPKLVVNASGAWVDVTNRKLGLSSRFVGGVKVSHIVVKHEGLLDALGGHGFVFEGDNDRLRFLQPLQDCVLIGMTVTPVDLPEDTACTDEEIDHFLGTVKRVFPDLNLTRQHMIFQLSSVSPLALGAATASRQPRRDNIEVLSGDWTNLAFPVHSLVGGSWTTFRAFAEQAADKALAHLGLQRTKDTHSLAIGGGRGYLTDSSDTSRQIESLSAWTGVPRERLKVLFERYGTRAEAVATFMNGGTDRILSSLPDYSMREIHFIMSHEKAIRLDDFLLRRTKLAMLGHISRETLDELAWVFATALGWSREEREAEVARTLSLLADRHGLVLPKAQQDGPGPVEGVRL